MTIEKEEPTVSKEFLLLSEEIHNMLNGHSHSVQSYLIPEKIININQKINYIKDYYESRVKCELTECKNHYLDDRYLFIKINKGKTIRHWLAGEINDYKYKWMAILNGENSVNKKFEFVERNDNYFSIKQLCPGIAIELSDDDVYGSTYFDRIRYRHYYLILKMENEYMILYSFKGRQHAMNARGNHLKYLSDLEKIIKKEIKSIIP
jgi:hypothetical protein